MNVYKIKSFDLKNGCIIEYTCTADTMGEAIGGIDESLYDIFEVKRSSGIKPGKE